MRKAIFVNEECHHIFNRGVDKRKVFLDAEDRARFLKSMREFNRPDAIGSLYEESFREKDNLGVQLPRLVEIVCYCLNPNHYHLVLKQLTDKGIEKFMQKLSTGYTNYFNKKYDHIIKPRLNYHYCVLSLLYYELALENEDIGNIDIAKTYATKSLTYNPMNKENKEASILFKEKPNNKEKTRLLFRLYFPWGYGMMKNVKFFISNYLKSVC